jgi:4-hydroxyphenylacetate 3-monooxygenase
MGQIHVPIEFITGDGGRATFAALLDTGFTGSIGIQSALIPALGWPLHGYVEAALASGTESLPVLIGQVVFDGRHQVVRAIVITIEQSVTSGLIYLNSSARDFQNPELRPYLDKYVRGSGGYDAENRVKLMKLLWDAIGTEFGARHELYEINYSGSTEENRLTALHIAHATGLTDRMRELVQACLAEYDLNGWTAADLINPDDISWLPKRWHRTGGGV